VKAIVRDRYGSPDVLRLGELEDPVPEDGEVLVAVRAASLNTADLDFLRGRPPTARLMTGLRGPKNPVLGFDVAGRVESVGRSVRGLRPGDEVWADLSVCGGGAFAEYVCAAEGVFRPKPVEMSLEEAATFPHSGLLALQSLRAKGGIRPGQRVLINGAGGCVGPFAVRLAKAAAAEVTAVDHAGKLEMLLELGADRVIDHTEVDVTRDGRTYDRILDIAATRPIRDFRRSLTPGGVYVMIAPSVARFLGAVVLGAVLSTGGRRMGTFPWRPNDRDDLELLGSHHRAGDLRPLIDRSYGLGEVPDALRYLEAGSARGKLVVTV
jgi:NADPH:quinone reductase-like Zn-dependent oxidoreductase